MNFEKNPTFLHFSCLSVFRGQLFKEENVICTQIFVKKVFISDTLNEFLFHVIWTKIEFFRKTPIGGIYHKRAQERAPRRGRPVFFRIQIVYCHSEIESIQFQTLKIKIFVLDSTFRPKG